MSCPSAETIELLAIEALESGQTDALLAHARVCQTCNDALAAARRAHLQRVRMYEAFDGDHDRLREQLLAALQEELPAKSGGRPGGVGRIGGWIMRLNTKVTRRAAVVLLPAACAAVAFFMLVAPAPPSAFAAAIAKIRDARTIVCRVQVYMNDVETPMQSGVMYLAEGRGMRFDTTVAGIPGASATLLQPESGPTVLLQPALKFALRMHMPPGMRDLSGPLNQTSPDLFLQGFRTLTGEADGVLGRSTIDGVDVEGFEISARKLGLEPVGGAPSEDLEPASAKLWVDASSHLPVRVAIELSQRFGLAGQVMRVKAVIDRFEFDKPLDAKLFELTIPDDVRVIDVTVPAPDEATFVAALRIYSDAAGRYPATVDASQMVAELMVALTRSGSVHVDPADPASAFAGEIMEQTMTVAMGCAFVQQLQIEGRVIEWFGDEVSPGEANAVLLRWKDADGATRVIYGDLRIGHEE